MKRKNIRIQILCTFFLVISFVLIGCAGTNTTKNSEINTEISSETDSEILVSTEDDTNTEQNESEPKTFLSAMSFNIYVGDQTEERCLSVLQTIQKYMPDTFGVQEADYSWMLYLVKYLGDTYDYIGEGTYGGASGSYSAIFYKRDKFSLVSGATRWLSDQPNLKGSSFPESELARNFSFAVLQEKQSKIRFLVINTHLDHSGPPARDKQIEVLMSFIEDNNKYPIVLTGDFNDNRNSNMYKKVCETLVESAQIATKAEIHNTFHSYGKVSEILDYIFVSEDSIDVSVYKVICDKENGMLPSDHYPVYIEFQIN